jgi:septum formation protein
MKNKLILASGSPQRKAILKRLGIPFKAIPSDVEETHDGLKKPYAIARHLAYKKAIEIARLHPNDWVLGCDTLVVLSDGRIAEKPKDRKDAKRTVKTYQNSYCDVYSGLALINLKAKKEYRGFEKTRLLFSDFTDSHIEEYLDSNEWQHRSGSMTIEGRGGKWVKRVKGDYWNVVGLPVNLVKEFILRSRVDK